MRIGRNIYRLEKKWRKKCDLLVDYVKEHGKLPEYRYITPDGIKLGVWITHQRVQYKEMRLDLNRIFMLDAVPHWSWNPKSDQWEENYKELCNYVKEHNRMPVLTYVSANGLRLGSWINRQRIDYKKNQLELDKIKLLESLTCWSWDPFSDQWDSTYNALSTYIEEHNRLPVRSNLSATCLRLGAWIYTQRTDYKNKQLCRDRIDRLEALSCWSWEPWKDQWENYYNELSNYIQEHKRLPVKSYVSENGLKLGNWIDTQRVFYKKNSLDREKIEKLESLTCWSWRGR